VLFRKFEAATRSYRTSRDLERALWRERAAAADVCPLLMELAAAAAAAAAADRGQVSVDPDRSDEPL